MSLGVNLSIGRSGPATFGGAGLPKSLLSVEGPAVGGYLIDTSGNGNNVQVVNNLLTNFDCERDFGYTAFSGTPVTNERSTEQAHSGTYSRKVVLTAAGGVKTPNFSTVTGEIVTWEFWIKPTANTAILRYAIRAGNDLSNVSFASFSATVGVWTKISGSYTETAGGNKAFIGVYISSGTSTYYLDDFKATVTTYGEGVILPDIAELKAADTENIFYDISGNALTVRHRIFWGDYGYNTWLYPNLGIKLYPPDLSMLDYLKIAKNLDYGKRFFDSIENTVTVKKDGTGDYLLPQSAVDAITTATFLNRFKVAIYDNFAPSTLAEYTKIFGGTYHRFIELKDHVYLEGVGDKKKIECTLPATITDEQSTYYECMVAEANTGARNLYFSQKNGRYACHIDGSVASGKLQEFYTCEFHHLGSQEIFDYRIANSLGYSGVFGGMTGFGTGSYSGQRMILKDCVASGIVPIGWHTNVNFSSTASLKLINCIVTALPLKDELNNPDSQVLHSILLSNLTSRLQNACDFIGGSINSFIKYNGEYYEPTATNLYILNDIILSLYPAVAVTNSLTAGGSLKISSANVGGSVAITGGTAQAVIMPTPDTVGNAAIGRLEVGEWVKNANTKLGVRLGNCSVTNKTLTLTVDGTINKTITFNQNFTAQTNAQVLAFINAALGVDATASLYQRAKDYLPTILT